jgi:hypothetical protein
VKARPFADGAWCALRCGSLVWFDNGLPTRVRLKPTGREDEVLDELGWLTGQRFRLGPVQDGEAQVLP